MIHSSSRYARAGTLVVENPRRPGEPVRVIRPRQTLEVVPVRLHQLVSGERLDHLAYAYYGDAGLWWLHLDAGDALLAEEIEVPGTLVPIAPLGTR